MPGRLVVLSTAIHALSPPNAGIFGNHDTAETLHARIQAAEHQLYPTAIRFLVEGRCEVRGRRVLTKA